MVVTLLTVTLIVTMLTALMLMIALMRRLVNFCQLQYLLLIGLQPVSYTHLTLPTIYSV